VLILANASAPALPGGRHLPLRAARGQVSHLPAAGSAPAIVVCRLGYVTPAIDGLRCAGATFAVDDDEAALRVADHAENLAKLDFILPGYSRGLRPEALGGRVGFRPLSPDRLPMIGAVADAGAVDPGRPSPPLDDLPRLPGLYLINGFGARGIVWSALAGELLACLITERSTAARRRAGRRRRSRALPRAWPPAQGAPPPNAVGRCVEAPDARRTPVLFVPASYK
jgi:tRNA 5-methylaminomethyl-2-thiouridine biosynthesis bifunctional protein